MREAFGVRQVIGSFLALILLVGAAAALVADAVGHGFGFSVGFGIVVTAATTWVLVRAMSGSPPVRGGVRMLLRSIAALLFVAGPIVLVVLGYAPILTHDTGDSADQSLLVVAGLLLVAAIPCIGLGARRDVKAPQDRR